MAISKKQRSAALGVGIALIVIVIAALAAREFSEEQGPVWNLDDGRMAGRVNDVVITEGDVTREVKEYREAAGIVEDEAWFGWLKGNAKTPEDFRSDRLEELIGDEVMRQAAASLGLSVSDEQVKAEVEASREQYLDSLDEDLGMRTTVTEENTLAQTPAMTDEDRENNWQNALRINGLNDRTFERHIRRSLTEGVIAQHVTAMGEVYADWMDEFTNGCDIERAPAPDDLPYLELSAQR